MVSKLDTVMQIQKYRECQKALTVILDIGRAAYPASQVPFRERREPFPTSISKLRRTLPVCAQC